MRKFNLKMKQMTLMQGYTEFSSEIVKNKSQNSKCREIYSHVSTFLYVFFVCNGISGFQKYKAMVLTLLNF